MQIAIRLKSLIKSPTTIRFDYREIRFERTQLDLKSIANRRHDIVANRKSQRRAKPVACVEFFIGRPRSKDGRPIDSGGGGVPGEKAATPSLPTIYWVWGSAVSSPSSVRGGAPDRAKVFHYFPHSGWPLTLILLSVDYDAAIGMPRPPSPPPPYLRPGQD